MSFNRYYLLLALFLLTLTAGYLGYRRRERQFFSSGWDFIPQRVVQW